MSSMNEEVNVTFTARELVDTYRAIRAMLNQLEPMPADEGISSYCQRLKAIHSKLIDATIAVASGDKKD